MIDGIEMIYQRIADAIVDAIPEAWTFAKIDAVYYSESIDYTGEYVTETGKLKDFRVSMDPSRAFDEMRRKLKEAGQPVWGQACFELYPDGKFNMKLGYDNCEANGDTIWDEDEWDRRQAERWERLKR